MNLNSLIRTVRDNIVHIRRASSNGIVVMAGLLAMRLSAFAISIMVARFAGAETFGQYTLFLTVFILASEIPHAFDTAYLRATGIEASASDKRLYAATNALAKLFLFSVISFLFYLSSDFISQVLNKSVAGDIFFWAIISGGLNSVYMLLPAIAQQRKDFHTVAYLKPVFNILAFCLVSLLFTLGDSVTISSIYDIYFYVGIILGGLALLFIFKERVLFKNSFHDIRTYLIVALTLLISTGISMIGNRMDVFFLGYYLNFDQLGVYGVALRISVVVSVMTAVMSTIMIPQAAAAASDPKKFKRFVQLGAFYSITQFVFAIVLLLFIEPLIALIFGDGYVNAALPAVLLIFQVLILSFGIPYQALLQCGNKPSVLIYVAIIKLIISILLMIVLVPRFGVSGAAVAVTSTTFLVTVIIISLAVKNRPTRQCVV